MNLQSFLLVFHVNKFCCAPKLVTQLLLQDRFYFQNERNISNEKIFSYAIKNLYSEVKRF